MQEIVKFLNQNTSGAFATVYNGKPSVRPWGFMMWKDEKFFFCTANTKDVYKQMKKNPFVEFTSTSKEMVTVRISGKAVFTDDINIKKEVLDSSPMVKGLYKSAENPVFEVFYIDHGKAVMSDFSGQPPRVFEF
jgi:uncharacterized pyridoxamine 5'-phosphate oxidase family protein